MESLDASSSRAGPSSSGLTLVLPSLKAIKELNAKKRNSPLLEPVGVKKIPRPIKLKPLKEVLTPLITKIKKKDDYAFFLQPVDTEKVPGYMDVIKQPMDFGTMTDKIAKSKYRSLDEFADDFRLVIANAKKFNPPGTIYHSEAERIEAWASDHISKAAAHVIEYEVDWNIEIERDEEVNVDADEDAIPAGASAGPDTPARRSPSIVSASVPPPNRRGRGSTKKDDFSESLEADGHLPGYKDGVGVFPPGSDWAEVMLALKLKGKRYRSKKERLRMEKGGPPYAPDGSLDYAEMEDPFSVLSALVPDPFSVPTFTPLFSPPAQDSNAVLPSPICVPAPKDPPLVPVAVEPQSESGKPKYRHWTVSRIAPLRGKAKETAEEPPPAPAWRTPRPLHTDDLGLFPTLTTGRSADGKHEAFGTQERLFEALRTSLESAARSEDTDNQAKTAQSWLREVVYGGFDGLAYARSVAEFVSSAPTAHVTPTDENRRFPLAEYVDAMLIDELTERRHRTVDAAITGSRVPDAGSLVSKPIPASPPLPRTPLDLGSLIQAPNELFDAERAWMGAGTNEDATVLARALGHAADLLERLHAQRAGAGEAGAEVKAEEGANRPEPDLETELRMNLIALAKRAPLDQIARMPPELVPPHLRHLVPTIGC
ncbi:hypothetical protein BC834DRAFT_971243 [Gloeopeniophorella convolvens]|nr:hypothetical protein BC834DRAFT_971243 [Gloeopeniophorella convolvens]